MDPAAPKQSKPLGYIVAAIMISYAVYALYCVIAIKSRYTASAEGIIKKVEGGFIPGNHVYVSQFSNVVTYEFSPAGARPVTGKVDSLLLSLSKAGDIVTVHYDPAAPGERNIPSAGVYGYMLSAVTLASIGAILLSHCAKMP